jgi:hypothetical protein
VLNNDAAVETRFNRWNDLSDCSHGVSSILSEVMLRRGLRDSVQSLKFKFSALVASEGNQTLFTFSIIARTMEGVVNIALPGLFGAAVFSSPTADGRKKESIQSAALYFDTSSIVNLF